MILFAHVSEIFFVIILRGYLYKTIQFLSKMLLKKLIILVIFVVMKVGAKLGPHHPRGSYVVKRETRKQEFSEHLNHKDKE